MSGDRVRMRPAIVPDIAEIMAIFRGRRAWLAAVKRSDQWKNVDEWRALLMFLIRHGNVWVLETADRQSIVGTITVGRDADVDFWTPAERSEPALYVSRLATDVEHAGQEHGARMLDWACGHARELGLDLMRLDTWRTSSGLRRYYATRGWRLVRDEPRGDRLSGALFERSSAPSEPLPRLTLNPAFLPARRQNAGRSCTAALALAASRSG